MRVDENGDIAKTNDIERDFPPNALRTIINKLFVLPDDLKSSWWEARDPRDQTIFQGEATHNDDVYTFKLAADGLLVYKKHKKDYTPIA